MEPKDDAMIRRKVQELESEPFSFDNERLWSSISIPAARRERSSLIYYVAASVALAWALVFLFQEFSRRDQLQVRLRELDLLIQSESARMSSAAARKPVEVPCESPAMVAVVVPPKRVVHRQAPEKQSIVSTVVASHEPIVSSSIATANIEESKSNPEPAPTAARSATKPRVILGSALPDRTQGIQRLRLGLFREEEGARPGAPLVTLAGVNNQ